MTTIRLRFTHLRHAEAVFRTERGLAVPLPAALFPSPLHEGATAELVVPTALVESTTTQKMTLNQLLHGELALPVVHGTAHTAQKHASETR